MLVSSHLLAEVAQTVDQVVIIDRGRLVAQSTLAALTAGADRTVRVRTPQPEALRDLLAARAPPSPSAARTGWWSSGPPPSRWARRPRPAGSCSMRCASALQPRGRLPRAHRGERRPCGRLVQAELLKLRTTRTALVLLALAAVGTAALVALVLLLAGRPGQPRSGTDAVAQLVLVPAQPLALARPRPRHPRHGLRAPPASPPRPS